MFFQKNIECHPLKKLSSWRRISLVTWDKPKDPSVYGVLDVDATAALQLIEKLRLGTGKKITITHLLIKALAKTLAQFPEINVVIRHNRLYVREHVDLFVQVFVEEEDKADLSGAKMRDAHLKSPVEIAGELEQQSKKIRSGNDPNLKKTKMSLNFLPPLLLKWSIHFLGYLGFDLNINPNFLGLPSDPFGAAMLTNVGMFGLKMGWAPLVPFSRTPIVFLAGEVTDQPTVKNGVIVIQPTLNIGVTIDHRIIDGYLGGKAAGHFKKLLENPEQLIEVSLRA
ncbi:MAG: 2-oxo acid dehydrogenase subunit E2 [Deltaproteobacteria bacterium]|nr:2-oxo acid dehydrogenase subunit E2 [Deltaproteobacteria bacterium]